MDEHDADLTALPDDPILADMRVDRVTRPDGRYLLYYSWHEGADDGGPTSRPPDGAADV